IAGVDEAGRGCLAGPVVAAAVILPSGVKLNGVKDSKKLSSQKRERCFLEIQKKAIDISIAMGMPEEIEKFNILVTSLRVMKRAIEGLKVRPDYVLIDGPYAPNIEIPYTCIIHGDDNCFSIAAASIVAKVYRDQIMAAYHYLFPYYNFKRNKGYPTLEHRMAIKKYGLCYLHRLNFKLPRYD
ncbi:MAG TPA: ribonuclease HII, partial [Candidatus Desulfofervidus auxilii]|nr:ribonuclease HII [Candidatus Desulfofervidus auxilii]